MSIDNAKQIIGELHDSGYEAYIVGGVIRDRLLKRKIGDIDIATSATPEEVAGIFNSTIPVGIEHGTIIVRWEGESYEVTTFRSEGKYEDQRHPSEVTFHNSIEIDLARRDFTINAMAFAIDGTILDPYGGRNDIERKLIRAVGVPSERFREDPLRMMRAIRFVSTLGFDIETTTEHALIANAQELRKISVERIREEFEKLLAGMYCQKALKRIEETNVDRYFPGVGVTSGKNRVLDHDWRQLESHMERWAAFAAGFETIELDRWLKAWKLPNRKATKIKTLFRLLDCNEELCSDWNLYTHGWNMIASAVRLRSFLKKETPSKQQEVRLRERYSALPIHQRQDLAVDGNSLQHMLGRDSGPWIGRLISELERNVVEGRLENDQEGIKEWVQQWGRRQGKN